MKVGIEIEFTGVARETVAERLSVLFNGSYELVEFFKADGNITRYRITDDCGHQWYIMKDRSIQVENIDDAISFEEFMCEFVTPVLDTKDHFMMNRFDKAIESIIQLGAVVNLSCGLHIHVDMHDLQWADKLFRRVFDNQNNLAAVLHIPMRRKEKYCKLYPEWFVNEYLEHSEFKSLDEWEAFFYDKLAFGEDRDDAHNSVRYYILNMNSIHKQNTIEFRPFNSTLSRDLIYSYLFIVEQICNFGEDSVV